MQYYIRQQKKFVSGPHVIDLIRTWIREGKVREDMEFSTDGVEWMFGIEMCDLFPARRRWRRVKRRSRRRA